jgi:queuine tRNA-ribosyltransferase subunit QTRTD1
MLTLPSLYELPGTAVLKAYKHSIHDFLNLKDHFLYLSIQDPQCPPRAGFNDEKSTSVWTNGGRMKVTVSGYVEFVRASLPNVFEGLCDSVSSASNKLKRIRKSVDRTLRFLDEIVNLKQDCQALQRCAVLGAVVGGDVMEERIRSATETAKRAVDGFVLEGFDLDNSRDCYQSILQTTTLILPKCRPRFIHGVYTPEDIFAAVECGVDVFDSACVYSATERGCAFTYPNETANLSRSHEEGSEEDSAAGRASEGLPSYEIDLNDVKYATDFSPVLRGCSCYCCQHHTRAYVHHLLHTREILASTLLMIHNSTHHMKFFASLRDTVRSASQTEYVQFKASCVSTCS